ncbi:hypothetical protein L1766_06635 [Thermovorax subterraneus]|nr:hypothetical protein [Thermovorax subterraneus]
MHKLNLIPEEYLKTGRKKRIKLSFIFSGLVLFIFMTVSVLRYNSLLSELKIELEELNKSIFFYRSSFGSGKDAEKLYLDLQERTKIINALLKDRVVMSEHLRKILETPPPGTILTSIDIDDDGNGVIKGISPEYSSIAYVIENLKKNNDVISKAHLGFIEKESEKNFYTFEIIFHIRGNDLIER